jgi:integrase
VSVSELSDGSRLIGPTKSLASRRVVAIPAALLPDVRDHLRRFVGHRPDAGVFVGPKGAPLRRANFQKHWNAARLAAGLREIHFHDLRHTGNTLLAQSGATLPDLMARMGHSSTRAALIYLHTSSKRDRVVADRLNGLVRLSERAREGHAEGPGD